MQHIQYVIIVKVTNIDNKIVLNFLKIDYQILQENAAC